MVLRLLFGKIKRYYRYSWDLGNFIGIREVSLKNRRFLCAKEKDVRNVKNKEKGKVIIFWEEGS